MFITLCERWPYNFLPGSGRPILIPSAWLKNIVSDDSDKIVRFMALRELARGGTTIPSRFPYYGTEPHAMKTRMFARAAVRELARGWGDHPEVQKFIKRLEDANEKTKGD